MYINGLNKVHKAVHTNVMEIRERCYWQVGESGLKGDACSYFLVIQTLKRHRGVITDCNRAGLAR